MNELDSLINDLQKLAGISQSLVESQQPWAWSYGTTDDYREKYDLYYILDAVQLPQSIWYPLIDANKYKVALSEFIKYGELIRTPSTLIEDWADIILRNTSIFANLEPLYGVNEDGFVPFDVVYDIFVGEYSPEIGQQFINKLMRENTVVSPKWAYAPIRVEDEYGAMIYILETNGVYEKLRMPDGHYDVWSDVGGFWGVGEFADCGTVEQALVLINRYLDEYHQRSDLASILITGGKSSLTKISNEAAVTNGNPLLETNLGVEQNPLGINITIYLPQIKQLDAELDDITNVYGFNVTESSHKLIDPLYQQLLMEKLKAEQEDYLADIEMRKEYFKNSYGDIENAIDGLTDGEEMSEDDFLNTIGKDFFNDYAVNEYQTMEENDQTDDDLLRKVDQMIWEARDKFMYPRVMLLEKVFNQNGFSLEVETSRKSDSTYFTLTKEFDDNDFSGTKIRWSDHTDYYASPEHVWFSDSLETIVETMLRVWSEDYIHFERTGSNV